MASGIGPGVRCSYRYEKKLQRQGFCRVAGLDEAGRGALCGPVVAAAVCFDGRPPIRGINDSKKLSAEARESLFGRILQHASGWGVGIVCAEEIDRINIYQATLKAMRLALGQVSPAPHFLLIDGRPIRGFPVPSLGVIKGDARCISVAAASIVAKVTRDYLMESYASMYPMYDWSHNKGYGCPRHFEALSLHGPTPLHRKTFKPVLKDLAAFSGEQGTQQLSLE
jgi:ribonuclease HII